MPADSEHREPGAASRAGDGDVLQLLGRLWRHRVLIAGAVLLGGILAAVIALLLPAVYTAKVTMLPQRESSSSGLLGTLAGLSGLPLEVSSSYEELYAQIVKSDRILDSLLGRTWRTRRAKAPATLFEIFQIESAAGDSVAGRRASERIKRTLRESVISFSRDKLTGYMILQVRLAREPELAAALANALAEQLDAYNHSFRRGKAAEQRQFVEDRLREVREDLRLAEQNLTEFTKTNRSYGSSPELLQQYNDLAREVEAQSSVWVELRRQLEIAKLEEHKELVTVDVLDKATVPVRKSGPKRLFLTLLGAMLGGIASVAYVLFHEQLRRWRQLPAA